MVYQHIIVINTFPVLIKIKYILFKMSNLNQLSNEEMEGYQENQQGYGDEQFEGEYSQNFENIQATAHFTHSQMNNIAQNNNLPRNDDSFNGNSSGARQGVSSQVNGYNLSGSERQGSHRSQQSANANQTEINNQGYSKLQSMSSQGVAQLNLQRSEQQNQNNNTNQNITQSKHSEQSSESFSGKRPIQSGVGQSKQPSPSPQNEQQLGKHQSQQSRKSNQTQQSQVQQIIRLQSQEQGKLKRVDQFSPQSESQFQESPSNSGNIQFQIGQAQASLYRSEPIQVTQQRTQQITRQQTFGYNDAGNRQLDSGEIAQSNSNLVSSQPSYNSNVRQNVVQGVSNVVSANPTILNRYFSAANNQSNQRLQPNQLSQTSSGINYVQPQNVESTIVYNQSNSSTQIRVQPQQIARPAGIQNIVIQNPNRILSNQVPLVSSPQSLKPLSPSIPNFVTGSPQPIIGSNQQIGSQKQVGYQQTLITEIRQTPGSSRPVQIQTVIQRPSGPKPLTPVITTQGPAIGQVVQTRPSRIFVDNQRELGGQRRSVSYGSNNSRGKNNVYFTYAHGVAQQVPRVPVQNQVQVIRQHTHTVIEKTTTVVWEHRYFTVIQKFNFVVQRFENIQRQIARITQLLQANKGSKNFELVYNDLYARHSMLLQLLSETQKQLDSFKQQNNRYRNQIQHESQLKQQALYKDKCRGLEQQNAKLKREIDRLLGLLNQAQAQLKAQNQNQNQAKNIQNTSNDFELNQLKIRIKSLQQQLLKSQTQSTMMQQYIRKLQSDTNYMAQEIDKYRNAAISSNANNNNLELLNNTLRQKQRIIKELEGRLADAEARATGGHNQDIQKYIYAINSLQAKIRDFQLQENSRPKNNEQDDRKFELIIENQKQMIRNLQSHFQYFKQASIVREEQLKKLLGNQQQIINSLQTKLRDIDRNNGNKNNQQRDNNQIDELKLIIQNLQREIQRSGDKFNSINEQLVLKNQQIVSLKQERKSYQSSMQQKLTQRLIVIQKQLKERQRDQKGDSPSPYRPQVDNSREIQQLVQQNERLSAQLRKRQQQKRKTEEEMIMHEENIRRKLMEKQSEVRLFNDKVIMIEQEYKRKFTEKERRIKLLQEQIQSLTARIKSNVSTPRNQPSQQNFEPFSPTNNHQLRSLKQKLSQREQQIAEIQRQKQNFEKRYQTLQVSFNSLDEQNSKKVQQIMNLKRQLSASSTYESEIKSLNDTMNKKNQEILQLKSAVFQRNQLKVEIEAIKNERNNLKGQIQAKNQQVDKLRQTIGELQNKIRESKQRQAMYPNTNQSAVEELQIMYETLKKKQAQMTKLKQSNQLLQTNVQELEYELQRAKGKIAALQKNLAIQKTETTNRGKQYETKIRQLESKAKSLQQSQRNSRNSLQGQLQNLQNNLKQKDEALRKMEGQNKILKNKVKNHDSKVQDYDSEIQALNKKIKQLESAREDLKKHADSLESGSQNNNKRLYDEYQIKIVELEAAVKVKDNKIKQLENTIETLKIKASHNNQTQDDFINQQQIQVLRKKVAEYQSRLYNQGSNKFSNYKLRDYQSTQVFEQKAIYDLKSENQRLKSLLSGKGVKYEIDGSSSNRGNFDYVQKRLLDFNQKLEQMIEENRSLQQRGGDYTMYLESKRSNQQLLNSFERERGAIIRRHRSEISALQARMVDLQRYCSSLESFQSTSVYNVTSNTKYTMNDGVKNIYTEQLGYYKEKNKQLEQRIDSHIKLNKQLKDKLQSMMKGGIDPNAIQFYKNQISQLQRQIAEYIAKIKALNEQIKSLSKALDSHKSDNSSQIKIHDLQNKIHELNRKISQLQMQNGILETDLAKYTQQLKNASDQAQRHKSGGQDKDQKLNAAQQNLRQANSKISNYQMQIVKLTNQIKLLEAESQRLNQKIKNKQAQENGQIAKLKSRISQLQTQLRELQDLSHGWNDAKNTYEQTISALNNRIMNLQMQISRLNTVYQNLIKKARQTQNDFFNVQNSLKGERGKIAELEAALKRKQLEVEGMNQFLQRLKKERDNEGTQTKQRLSYISQLEQTIRALKLQVSQYKSQLERVKAENERRKQESNENRQKLSSLSSMEEIIKQLRMEIQLCKGEIQRLKSANEQYKQKISSNDQFEHIIEELRIQIVNYRSEIDRLKQANEQLRQKVSSNSQLQYTIQSLKAEISNYKVEIEKYKITIQQYRVKLSESSQLQNLVQELRLQVYRYKAEIQRLKSEKDQQSGQNSQSQSFIYELQQTIKNLRIQIETYKQQNYRSTNEIERLRIEIHRLQQQINKLRIHIENIEKEMQLNQQIIDGIAYRLEFIRSSYIEIEVLHGQFMIDQSNHRQVELKQTIQRSISVGLKTCSETFAML